MNTKMKLIRPCIPPPHSWIPYLESSYHERQFSNNGPCVKLLEHRIEEYYAPKDRGVILTANATAGLSAALMAIGGLKSAVLFPEFTFAATPQAIRMAGYCPIPVACSNQTMEMDPNALKDRLSHEAHQISAVVYVRAFGMVRNLEWIEEVCRAYGKPLIVDSAAAFGGRVWDIDDPELGSIGDAEVFSCHATKPFAMGEGGIVMAEHRHLPAIRQKINFGIGDRSITFPAMNGKMSEFHAAVGLAMLDIFSSHLKRRREIADRYIDHAERWGSTLYYNPRSIGYPPWHVFPLLLEDSQSVWYVQQAAEDAGIETRRYYAPLYANQHDARSLCNRVLCLPVYSDMLDSEIQYVIDTIDLAFATKEHRYGTVPRTSR